MNQSDLTIIPDFPKKGVSFIDIFPLLNNPEHLKEIISFLDQSVFHRVIVVPEARGFLLSSILQAIDPSVVVIPCRKKGKLPPRNPHDIIAVSYEKEYGTDTLEIRRSDIKASLRGKGLRRVTFLDDILATGQTAAAVSSVLEEFGLIVSSYVFLGEVKACNGRSLLGDVPIHTLFQV